MPSTNFWLHQQGHFLKNQSHVYIKCYGIQKHSSCTIKSHHALSGCIMNAHTVLWRDPRRLQAFQSRLRWARYWIRAHKGEYTSMCENKWPFYLNLGVKYYHIFSLFIIRGCDCMNLKQVIWAASGGLRDTSLKIVSYQSTKIDVLIDEI